MTVPIGWCEELWPACSLLASQLSSISSLFSGRRPALDSWTGLPDTHVPTPSPDFGCQSPLWGPERGQVAKGPAQGPYLHIYSEHPHGYLPGFGLSFLHRVTQFSSQGSPHYARLLATSMPSGSQGPLARRDRGEGQAGCDVPA